MNSAKVLQFPEASVAELRFENTISWGETGRTVQITPYRQYHKSLEQTIAEYGIKMPFDKIITKDMGISVCPHCGARYAGSQDMCTAMVWWMKFDNSYHWKRGNAPRSAIVDTKDSWGCRSLVTESRMASCATDTKWDLQEEFNAQVAFFDFVAFMQNVQSNLVSPIHKYRDALPPGASEQYRIMYLEQKIMQQDALIHRLESFAKNVVDKMSNAGHSLMW